MKLNRLTLGLALLASLAFLLLGCAPARAQLLLKSGGTGTNNKMFFLLISSTDHISPVTGVTPVVKISKAGATGVTPSGAVSEVDSTNLPGWYQIAANATDTSVVGELLLHATGTGADPVDRSYYVVSYDPSDAVALGLSRIDAAVSSRSTYAGADTAGTTTLLTRVPGTVQPQTGDAFARLGAPAGASHAADVAAVSTKLGTPAGASIAADIAALPSASSIVSALMASSYITIAADHTVSGSAPLVLTYKQWIALQDAVSGGDNTSTAPVASSTATVSYYLRGQAKTSPNLVAVATVTYDSAKNQTARAVKVVAPFPTIP